MSSSLVLSLGDLGELRGTNHPEHGQVWSIRDFINMVKEKPYGSKYGVSTWLAMLDGEYGEELARHSYSLIIPGIKSLSGQYNYWSYFSGQYNHWSFFSG